MKKNLIRFDWAIKRMLRNKANFGILEGLLSELLGEDIKIESILESESNKETGDNKMNRVDMLVQDSKGELIIIEVQSTYTSDFLIRMLFGTSKLLVDNVKEGSPYSTVRKIISVNIVYFDLGHGDDYIYHGTTNFVGIHKKDILDLSETEQIVFKAEKIEQIYPEYYIIKVNKFDDVAKNTLDEWIDFLKNETVQPGTKAKGLIEAKEKLDILKLSPAERLEYERDMNNKRDNESAWISNFLAGEVSGIKKGEANKEIYAGEKTKEKQLEMARKCLIKGMPIPDIAELTGLTEDEIEIIVL